MVAYNALFPEVAPKLRDRVDLSATREILATFALLISFILAPIIAEEVGYIWMGAIMGVLVAAGYLVSMIGVKEGPIPADEKQMGIWRSLKVVLSSVPFRWFLGANIAKEYIWLVLAAQLPFWRKYVLGIQEPINVFGQKLSGGDAEAILLGLPILLTIPVLLMWRPVVLRLGYRRTWIIASLTFIPGLLIIALANDFFTGLLGTLLAVPGLAGSMIMPFPILSEIIDEDAKKEHGYRREGLFFGMNHGIVKLSFSAQGVLFAGVMTVTGYVAGQAIQTTSAINGIRFLIGGTPILASLIIAICMYFYPLGRKSFD
jgi:GPH family glycoside/pentoside/hexuronide:cation symporter